MSGGGGGGGACEPCEKSQKSDNVWLHRDNPFSTTVQGHHDYIMINSNTQ